MSVVRLRAKLLQLVDVDQGDADTVCPLLEHVARLGRRLRLSRFNVVPLVDAYKDLHAWALLVKSKKSGQVKR